MDPKQKKPGSKELELLELTLTQDIKLPFDEADDERSGSEDQAFQQEDFETP